MFVAVAAFPDVLWFRVGKVAFARLMDVGVPKTEPFGTVTVPVNVGDASGAAPNV
jgi:hypothetical protein